MLFHSQPDRQTTKSNTVVKLRIPYLTMNRLVLISMVFSAKNPNIRCEMGLTKNCCRTHEYGSKCTLQFVTAKFAHMNGHWKAYDLESTI